MNLLLEVLLSLVMVGLFRLLGLLRFMCLIAGFAQGAAGHGFTAVLLLWVAFVGVKDE
jgi:hypothetical protein